MLSMYQALYQAFICTVSLNRPIHYTHVTDEETGSRNINNLPKVKKRTYQIFIVPAFGLYVPLPATSILKQ